MPKLKTHSGAKKRFNLTKTGILPGLFLPLALLKAEFAVVHQFTHRRVGRFGIRVL